MNKFLALLITATILLWGVFLFKMSNKVDGGKFSARFDLENSTESSSLDVEKQLDFKSLLARLEPQIAPVENLRDPFAVPSVFAPTVARPRAVKSDEPPADTQKATVIFPSIALDAILPGDKPVAILKYRGESAVVCVGQEIWDVTVVAIGADQVTLKYEGKSFEVK